MSDVPQPSERDGVSARTEVLLAAMLSAVAIGAVALFPLLVPAAVPLVAVPAVRVAHRHGGRAGWIVAAASAAAAVVLGAAASGGAGALAGGLVALPAVGLPAAAAAAVRRGAGASAALLGLVAAGIACMGVALLASPRQTAEVTREVDRSFQQSVLPGTLERYRSAGMKTEEIEQARRILETLRVFFVKAWPGLLASLWVVGAAAAFYVGGRLARPAPSAEAVRFERLRLPPYCALLFVLSGAAAALVSGPVRVVAGNLLPSLAALFFLAGLSIICGFARRWFRVAALRAGLYLLAAYPPMCFAVTLLGLFDWYADFRKIGEGATKAS
jgi:hypothetical protein